MDTQTFLQSVLGDDGWYCVWANRLSDKKRTQVFYDSIEALAQAAISYDQDGYDAYFALGTFVSNTTREADNVAQLRACFLDLDCGPLKDYPDQPSALRALREFCKTTHLPRPTVVNSGRGIHVYWGFTTPVPKEDWLPVAARLKSLCRTYDLHADSVVTADAARVLRVPGTSNYKSDPPSPVGIVGSCGEPVSFEDFSALINAEEHTVLKPSTRFIPSDRDNTMQALSGSIVNKFCNIKGCAQLAYISENQSDVSEPLWRAGLSIAVHCVDKDDAIHLISKDHPAYTPEDTQAKAAQIKGPYLCDKFNEFRPNVCTECSHWEKIKSPITLGREVEEASDEDNVVLQAPLNVPNATPIRYTIPKYPHPYFRGKTGGVFRHAKGEDGEPKDELIYFNDLYVVRRLKDPEMGEALVMRLHLPKDGVREFTVPLTAVGSKDEYRKFLAAQGVALLAVNNLMEYTMRWVHELQLSVEAEDAQRQFGWLDDSGTCFAAGPMLIYKDRVEVNAPSGATIGLFPYFMPKGTLEAWKETMNFYNKEGMEPHKFMVGLQFGAQLMEFQPINAAAFHMYSKESGLGKTTGMLAGASVWGSPDMLMLQERDTFNSKMNRAEVYKNFAVYMDEMTNTKPNDLSDYLYQIPSGQQRNRMGSKANAERVRGKPWKTLFGTTGNTSMIERISSYKAIPQAEAQRVFEYRVDKVSGLQKVDTDEFVSKLKENYGHAGIIYIQYVMNNLEACKDIANNTQQRIDQVAGLTEENRFWSALISRVIAGIIIAKKAGLLDWEVAPIAQWAVKAVGQSRTAVQDMHTDVETILTDYLAEHYNSMLRIRSTDDARKSSVGIDHLITPDAAPRGNQFIARYEYDVKKLYLLPRPLRLWCAERQINYLGFVDGLRQGRTQARMVKMRLSKGTRVSLPPADVLMINCAEFMDDEAEESMAAIAANNQIQD